MRLICRAACLLPFAFLMIAGLWAAPRPCAADAREDVIRSPEDEKKVQEKLKAQAAEEEAKKAAMKVEADKRAAETAARRNQVIAEAQVIRAFIEKLSAVEKQDQDRIATTQDPKERELAVQQLQSVQKQRADAIARLKATLDMAAEGGATAPALVDPKMAARGTSTPGPSTIADASNRFGFDLYGRIRAKEGNLFFSPSSISNCLAMAYAGARGQTATEMAKVLHTSLGPAPLAAGWASLNKDLASVADKGFELSVANALWGQKGYGFLPDYLALVKTGFGAGFEELDFAADADGARQTINKSVEKLTREKIKDLIGPGMLSPATRMVLTNAIYFKGAWAVPFIKDLTKEEDFTVGPDKKVRVPMMALTESFQFADAGDCLALALPYKGGAVAMVVLLPKKPDGLADLEKGLTAEKLAGHLSRMKGQDVEVHLPKLKFAAEMVLARTLADMGMPDAFDAAKADFKGINGGKEPLWISEVIHKAFVDVNEEGTEAAAATATAMEAGDAPKPPPVFRADHPFVFLIRDVRSGGILFMGRVANPKE